MAGMTLPGTAAWKKVQKLAKVCMPAPAADKCPNPRTGQNSVTLSFDLQPCISIVGIDRTADWLVNLCMFQSGIASYVCLLVVYIYICHANCTFCGCAKLIASSSILENCALQLESLLAELYHTLQCKQFFVVPAFRPDLDCCVCC